MKFRSIGWAAAQDPIYGVDHDNIEPELTVENWEDKAIVRSGLYIWVTEGKLSNDDGGEERCYSVQIYSDQQGRDREKDLARVQRPSRFQWKKTTHKPKGAVSPLPMKLSSNQTPL